MSTKEFVSTGPQAAPNPGTTPSSQEAKRAETVEAKRADSKALGMAFGDAWTYAPAPEASDHVKIQPRYELFIGGQWRAPESKAYFDTINPATEEKLAEVASASAKDVDLAVQAARTGYEKYWSKLRPLDRGKYIFRIARALQEKAR